jgi:probable HAF family extracellular repeat protein
MVDLGSLGGSFTEGLGINNAGAIVGVGEMPPPPPIPAGEPTAQHAFRTSGTVSPTMQDLGVPTGMFNSIAHAINNSGQIAASAIIKNPTQVGGLYPWHGYLIQSGQTMSTATDIGSLGGTFASPEAINASGQIAGWSQLAGGTWHAFRYTPGSGMVDLGAPGATYSQAHGINDAGEVVGAVAIPGGSLAFRTKPNSAITAADYLGSLGGTYVGAMKINNAGQVTGYSDLASGTVSHAFRTKPNAAIDPLTDDLGVLPGGSLAMPHGINIAGDVVGDSSIPGGNHAFIVYGDSNTMYDLNDLITNRGTWVFNAAEGINDQGYIVARASLNGGSDHAYLLVPVPEPVALAPVAIAACILRRATRRWY